MTFSAFKWPTTCSDGSNNKLRYCFQFTLITHIIFAKARIFKNIYQFTTFCSIIICFIFSNFANLVSNQYLAFLQLLTHPAGYLQKYSSSILENFQQNQLSSRSQLTYSRTLIQRWYIQLMSSRKCKYNLTREAQSLKNEVKCGVQII